MIVFEKWQVCGSFNVLRRTWRCESILATAPAYDFDCTAEQAADMQVLENIRKTSVIT